MDLSTLVMWTGFFLAAYSVVGNDVIQTLGTFLTSNEQRLPWYVLWLFAAGILTVTLVIGHEGGNMSYGRLDKFSMPEYYHWYFLLPPLVLMIITRFGIPVSTTFMILTLFSLQKIPNELPAMVSSVFDTNAELGGMIKKSLIGYMMAFGAALVIYLLITGTIERYFIEHPTTKKEYAVWTVLQWGATGFLWSQWLIQDLANIYIYLKGGYNLSNVTFYSSLLILLVLLGYIFYSKGGKVQDVIRVKTNTADIRSATIIDFIYGLVLFFFKDDILGIFGGKIPMSTTWVFVGILAGREIAIHLRLEKMVNRKIWRIVGSDLLKVFAGLVISVVLVFVIKLLAT